MIMANGRQRFGRDRGRHAAKIAIMTAGVESTLQMYANDNPEYPGIEESKKYRHDAVGHDHDSLNYFQQRLPWGGRDLPRSQQIANLMNDDYAIGGFYGALADTDDWETRPLGEVAQDVQGSKYPDRYALWEDAAEALLVKYY